MEIIQPINTVEQAKVIERVRYYIELASSLYGQQFTEISVIFNLRGKAAGMYRCYRSAKQPGVALLKAANNNSTRREIRFNPWLFAKYPEDSYDNTVPHEVAHYLSDCLYGLNRIKPHGPEWKSIMRDLGAEPNVRGSYTLEGIPVRKVKRYDYACACRQVELTSYRHVKIQKGIQQYRCRDCNEMLMPILKTAELMS